MSSLVRQNVILILILLVDQCFEQYVRPLSYFLFLRFILLYDLELLEMDFLGACFHQSIPQQKKKLTNQKTAAILSLSPFCCLFHIYCFQGRKSSHLNFNFSFLCPLLLLSFASHVYRACRHCCPDFFGRFHFPVCLLFFHFLFCCCCAVIVSSITLSLELNNCMKRNCFKCMNFTIYNLQFYCKFTRCICCILIQTFAKLVTHAT